MSKDLTGVRLASPRALPGPGLVLNRSKGQVRLFGIAGCMILATAVVAQDALPLTGTTLRVHLIGGQSYEALYATIPAWEAATGATVEILSQADQFTLDHTLRADLESGTRSWCVASVQTDLVPDYATLFMDLSGVMARETLAAFTPLVLDHATIDGRLVLLPRHSNVSALFYQTAPYADAERAAGYAALYDRPFAPAATWADLRDQAAFFTRAPDLYGTAFVLGEAGLVGRFHELLVAHGGAMFDASGAPAFDSPAGIAALTLLAQIHGSGSVPPESLTDGWTDTGTAFASGRIAISYDWAGWASYLNDPAASMVAGQIGVARSPAGVDGMRAAWAGTQGFGISATCDNADAALSFVKHLTSFDSQMIEARLGHLPTRPDVWAAMIAEYRADGDAFMAEAYESFQATMAEDAITAPRIAHWPAIAALIWPELQAAIRGRKSPAAALAAATDAVRIVAAMSAEDGP